MQNISSIDETMLIKEFIVEKQKTLKNRLTTETD